MLRVSSRCFALSDKIFINDYRYLDKKAGLSLLGRIGAFISSVKVKIDLIYFNAHSGYIIPKETIKIQFVITCTAFESTLLTDVGIEF